MPLEHGEIIAGLASFRNGNSLEIYHLFGQPDRLQALIASQTTALLLVMAMNISAA